MGALWLSPFEREEGNTQMWLMQREPSGSHTDIPLAPGNHSSVTKHLHSIACLQIQWYPETHIFPSLSTVAKHGQFLERSTARSPALGLNGHSHLLFNPDNFFSGSRLGRLLARVKEIWVGIPVLCAATAPTDCPELHPIYEVQEASGQPE